MVIFMTGRTPEGYFPSRAHGCLPGLSLRFAFHLLGKLLVVTTSGSENNTLGLYNVWFIYQKE